MLIQVGVVSGEGRNYQLPFSGHDQVRNMDRWSNVDSEGMWMFQLGPLDPAENVRLPLTVSRSRYDPGRGRETARDCNQLGSTLCHSEARCQTDTEKGFCCTCRNGW